MGKKRILSLGQCTADHHAIARIIGLHFDAEVLPAATSDEALAMLHHSSFDLILVNRILDADGSSGLAFLDQLQQGELRSRPPVMLVSNHAEAQQEAVARGARPGFGKDALTDPATIERLAAELRW